MSSELQWYRVRLAIPTFSAAQAPTIVVDLQEELELRPHLDQPLVSWTDSPGQIVIEVSDQARSAEQAAAGMAEEIFEATCAVVADTDGLRVELLGVEPRR